MRFKTTFLLAILFAAAPLFAAVIGTNTPAQPLTRERIAALPATQQSVWLKYLEHSERQMRADRAFLRNELRTNGLAKPTMPREVKGVKGLVLKRHAAWYGQTKARRIAGIIVSFQTPAGGWSKNLDMTSSNRAPGEAFAPDNNSVFLSAHDFDRPLDMNWDYVGTFDNDATTTQLRFLARVITASPEHSGIFRSSFLRGLRYIFAAQYPNGGWPQVWPLQGGYHDAITLNDDAMLNVLTLLHNVAAGTNQFAFVPAAVRAQARASFRRGLDCLLACQMVVKGRHTVWCQQYEPTTLQPASARNYEMPALASGESAHLVLFLMQLRHPNSQVAAAIRAAVAWFEATKLNNVAFRGTALDGRMLVPAPGKGPIWSRYYQIGTDRPIFGDRDKSIHDNVNEISRERRRGYAWFNNVPKRVLEHFRGWSRKHPAGSTPASLTAPAR